MTDLSNDELRAVFERDIRPKYDRLRGAEAPRPTFVLVCGQPGSGKTETVASARLRMPTAIEVIGDDLRRFHSAFPELMRIDPLRMPVVTQAAANAWVHLSLDYLREQRASVLMETTLRDPDAVQNTLAAFRAAEYEVELRVVAVPETLSRLGTVERFVGQAEREGGGRWAHGAVHDAAYERAPEVITRAITAGLVDRVVVQQRDDRTLLDAAINRGAERDVRTIIDALTDGRRMENMTPGHAGVWLRGMERSTAFLTQNPQLVNDDIAHTLRRLGADAPNVVRAAFPDDASRQDEAAANIRRLVSVLPESSAAAATDT